MTAIRPPHDPGTPGPVTRKVIARTNAHRHTLTRTQEPQTTRDVLDLMLTVDSGWRRVEAGDRVTWTCPGGDVVLTHNPDDEVSDIQHEPGPYSEYSDIRDPFEMARWSIMGAGGLYYRFFEYDPMPGEELPREHSPLLDNVIIALARELAKHTHKSCPWPKHRLEDRRKEIAQSRGAAIKAGWLNVDAPVPQLLFHGDCWRTPDDRATVRSGRNYRRVRVGGPDFGTLGWEAQIQVHGPWRLLAVLWATIAARP